ncbi:hypothetical protein [Streptomyces sp. HUAS ZL42]|uniref:DUF6907 domain-containing protein n=1 Tax=Streptomyces sp. HUAS ZL42 TaxID=3231715 RepID=UPI00345E93A0
MSNKTITATSETALDQAPATDPRTITYPLKGGGSLTTACPSWCTADHSDDVARGINPDDLMHQGDAVSLGYNTEGVEVSILQARIEQWPFSGDPSDASPHVELTPEGSTATSVYCFNRLQLDDEIRKVRAHLQALIELGDQLAEAQADEHARQVKGDGDAWMTLARTDLQALPVSYLLRTFGVTVVETEDTGRKAVVALYGEPGAMELRVKPDVKQYLREDQARRQLLDWYDATWSARRD